MDRSRPSPSCPRLPVCGSVQSIRPDWTEPYRGPGSSGLGELLLTPPPVARRLLLHPVGWELPDVSGRQEVHHRLVAHLHGEHLRDLHVTASARSPSRCLPHLFPERLLPVFPSDAVAEEMFPRLGRPPASAAAPPACIVVSVSEPFYVRGHWRVSGLRSAESRCQCLHAILWDGSLAPSFALQPVAVVFVAFVSLSFSLRRRLCF